MKIIYIYKLLVQIRRLIVVLSAVILGNRELSTQEIQYYATKKKNKDNANINNQTQNIVKKPLPTGTVTTDRTMLFELNGKNDKPKSN